MSFSAIPPSGNNNEYLGNSDTFTLNAAPGNSTLRLLEDFVNGNQYGYLKINYTDGSHCIQQFYVADWLPPSFGANEY